MTTDKQVIQWIRQHGGYKPPENLYWYAIIEDTKIIKISVEDELFHKAYGEYPSAFPNMKPVNEDAQIGD